MDPNQIVQPIQPYNAEETARPLEHMTHVNEKKHVIARIGCYIIACSLFMLAFTHGIGLKMQKVEPTAPPLIVSPTAKISYIPNVVHGVGFGMRKAEEITTARSTAPAMTSPVENLDLLFYDLPLSTQQSLQNTQTPQRKAFEWLSQQINLTQLPEWRKKQRFALATFYYAFGGESWELVRDNDKPLYWMDYTIHECDWYSFFPCNYYGDFEQLAMAFLNLSILVPSIPPEIALLSSLSRLDLSVNEIAAPLANMVPVELHQLQNLTEFSFGDNHLTGIIPSELGLLTILTRLDLRQNSLSGPLPSELGLMTSMKNLQLYWNSLSGSLPSDLGRLSNIPFIELDVNSLTGLLPSELGLLTGTSDLKLSFNSFFGALPSELGRMRNLNTLELRYNSLTGFLPSELGLLTDIFHLDLSNNALSGSLPSELGLLTNIYYLDLSNNALSGPLPSELGRMTNLEFFWLNENNLISSLPSELGLITNLHLLDVSSNVLSGSLPTEFGKLTSMLQLNITENSVSGPLPSEFGGMRKLKILWASSTLVTGLIPTELSLLTALRHFNIMGTGGLSGTIPEDFCFMKNSVCAFPDNWQGLDDNWQGLNVDCRLVFDCTASLCGCECKCAKDTVINAAGIERVTNHLRTVP